MIINKPGRMTKMVALPIYGKNLSKIFFADTVEPNCKETRHVAIKARVQQCINHDPLMTVTDFTARSI